MSRSSLRRDFLCVLLLAAVAVVSASGCRSVLTLAAYMIRGTDVKAEYEGLEGKKLVVVCRAMQDMGFGEQQSAASEIAEAVGNLLKQNVSEMELVPHGDVEAWCDENVWTEYAEVGQALDAEMIVAIDLESFSTKQSQTLHQGKANLVVRVFDRENQDAVAFEREIPQVVYPPNVGIPTADKSEAQFNREFVAQVADRIGRHFYSHDPYSDYAGDAAAFQTR